MTDMTDIVERAEASLEVAWSREGMGMVFASVVEELITALKAARAENEQLRRDCRPDEVYRHTAEEWGEREGCRE